MCKSLERKRSVAAPGDTRCSGVLHQGGLLDGVGGKPGPAAGRLMRKGGCVDVLRAGAGLAPCAKRRAVQQSLIICVVEVTLWEQRG